MAERSLSPVPIVNQFEGQNFEIHADRSMTMAAVLDKCAKNRPEEHMIQGGGFEQGRGFEGYNMPRNNTAATVSF